MKRNIERFIIFIFILIIPTLISWLVTIKRGKLSFYTDSFYIFFLALIAVVQIIGSLDDIISFIDRIIGPNYLFLNNEIAKKMLKDIAKTHNKGIQSEIILDWFYKRYKNKLTKDEILLIFQELIDNKLIVLINEKIYMTKLGEEYYIKVFT